MEAFVYCWTDHKTNMLYIGSHKGTENDGYVCSSKLMLEEYNKRPNDFTRQIIAYGIETDIRRLEGVLLRLFKVRTNESFTISTKMMESFILLENEEALHLNIERN